jgi:Pumilio-family RNA binding repeat
MSQVDSTASSATNGHRTVSGAEKFSDGIVSPPTSLTIDSLGEALAGVNISSSSKTGFGSSAINTVSFGMNSGDNDGWGNFTSPASTRIPEETSGESHVRNESLELFLSQSPSQTLGDDVFRFSHTNLPSLAEERHATDDEMFRLPVGNSVGPGASTQHSFGEMRSQESNRHRRVESPSCSVTGTTTSSRSVSPYANSNEVVNRSSIPPYQRYETPESGRNKLSSFVEEDRSNSIYNNSSSRTLGNSSHVNIPENAHRTAYAAKDRQHFRAPTSYDNFSYDKTSLYNGQDAQQNHNQQMQLTTGQQPQQQVLYMPVPSPDGHGQVLQPVQIMQMPGKPYTLVIPGGTNISGMVQGTENNLALQSTLPSSTSQHLNDYSHNGVLRDTRNRYGGFDEHNSNLHYNSDPSYGMTTSRMGPGMMDDYKESSLEQDLSGDPYTSDPSIASLYAAPQRPPLDALLGQVRRLSRDQVGCRLVQQALDEDGPMAATLILNEGLPFWGEAMVDPFGNYLFQKIMEKITGEERVMLVKSVSSRLVNASLNLHGTRSVQKVVELCAVDELDGNVSNKESAAMVLTNSLLPAAARLCIDSHGNHVIQRILLRLSPVHSQFVFDAVAASVADVARHRHGCCVIQRCLDSPPSAARSHLVHRIVEKSLELMQDAYGNYVVQYVLDVCTDEDVHAVCESVVGKVNSLAIQKFSSNVMEKCLERCSDRVKEMYLQEMSDPEHIRELMMDPFGNYVVQRALSVATHSQAIRLVEAMRPHLLATQVSGPGGARNGGVRNTAGGRRIIAKICRRFPNFTLNPVGTHDELYSQNKASHRYLNHHQQSQLPHNFHKQAPMLASYGPMGVQPMVQTHYSPDPRLVQNHIPLQQQQPLASPYGANVASGNPYYDPFAMDAHVGYPGM